jgi:hypothetical protein
MSLSPCLVPFVSLLRVGSRILPSFAFPVLMMSCVVVLGALLKAFLVLLIIKTRSALVATLALATESVGLSAVDREGSH